MMTLLLAPLPMLAVLLLVLVATVPWGGPDWLEMALALLPMGAIYFWSLRRPQLMPALLVFLCGLTLDVLTYGPLGIWSCSALAAALAGRLIRRARPGIGWLAGAGCTALVLTLSAAIAAGLISLAAWHLVPLGSWTQSLLAACLGFPILAGLLSRLDAAWPLEDERSLFLRGD